MREDCVNEKAEKSCGDEKLSVLAKCALEQMNERQYDEDLNAMGVNKILKYGIAFSGKSVCVKAEMKENNKKRTGNPIK